MVEYKHYKKKTVYPDRVSKQFKDFKWTWKSFVIALKKRLEIEKDGLIFVTGRTGSGKSHWTGNLALKYFSKELNFIKNDGSMMFTEDNFITTADKLAIQMITKSGCFLWVDEGRGSVNRREWYNSMNKTIVSRKNTNRKLRNLLFVLVPFEREIDPAMAAHATMWVWVRRGVAEIFTSVPDFKGSKGLDIQAILDRDTKYRQENPQARFVPPYIHPEFAGRVFFKGLTAGYKAQYDRLVEENKAAGELTEEEKLEAGLIEDISPETKIKDMVDLIFKGELTDKKEIWDTLKKETKLDHGTLEKRLNFYLKLNGLPTFSRLFN
jgi:energy-coupling factor transporter ATP-binding protein EcfA2